MQFAPNGIVKTLFFGDVKVLRKFESYYPQRNNFSTLVLEFGKLVKTVHFCCGRAR